MADPGFQNKILKKGRGGGAYENFLNKGFWADVSITISPYATLALF